MNDTEFDLRGVSDAEGVERLARQLYGEAFAPGDTSALASRDRIIHVTAIEGVSRRALRIDEHTPKSAADTFALNLARARAHAIVITGKLLRDEPMLSYAPGAPGPLTEAFSAYRRQLGHRARPCLVVLTRGAGLPYTHPVFHDGHTLPLVVAPTASASTLRREAPCEVLDGGDEVSLPALVTALRARDAHTISFEAGPSTTRELYTGDAALLDEVCLSTYEGPSLGDARLADAAPALPAALTLAAPPSHVQAPSGPWTFARYVRTRPAESASI